MSFRKQTVATLTFVRIGSRGTYVTVMACLYIQFTLPAILSLMKTVIIEKGSLNRQWGLAPKRHVFLWESFLPNGIWDLGRN